MEKTKHEMTEEILNDWNNGFSSDIELPSAYQVRQVVKLQFRKNDDPFHATVRGVHFYNSKVKYDLGLWLGDGSVDDPEVETRIYNVDSAYITLG